MSATDTTITIHPDLNVGSAGVLSHTGEVIDLTVRGWTTQKPYRNGVTVHTNSGWLGNGFGNSTHKVAVNAEGQIVAVYWRENFRSGARVIGHPGDIYEDRDSRVIGAGSARRVETWVTKTALSKWTAAVKAL